MDALGHHADEQDGLVGHHPGQVEERVEQVAGEHVAGHVLGRRHVLQRRIGEQLPDQLGMGQLEQERVRHLGVDLERVPQAELGVGEPRLAAEVLVQQLRHHHGVRRVHRVGGGQVVVLAGVDDDAGPRVHLPGEPLVDERPHRVDVAEDDAVHAVVQHHVEALEPGQRGDLRHAQAGGVVGQPDVAAELAGHVVQRGAHQPEVLPGGVGPGVPLPGRALRHVVQQRLPGGPDHRDDVGPLPRRRLRLRDVLVDVPGRHDQVDPRHRRVGGGGNHLVPLRPPVVDQGNSFPDRTGGGIPGRVSLVPRRQTELDQARGGVHGQRAQVGVGAASHRVPDRQGDPVLEPGRLADRVGEPVHPRHPVLVRPVQAGQPQHGAFHGDGGMRPGQVGDRLPGEPGQLAGLRHQRRVQVQLAVHEATRCSNSFRTDGTLRIRPSARSACPGTYPLPTSIVTSAASPSAPSAAAAEARRHARRRSPCRLALSTGSPRPRSLGRLRTLR